MTQQTTEPYAGNTSSAASRSPAQALETRRSVGAGRLRAPGPDGDELRRLLTIAARVPDHGALVPWRFIVVEGSAGPALAGRLGDACLAAAEPTDAGQDGARRIVGKLENLFGRPPLVVVVVSRPDPTASIPLHEQVMSAGAVCMNLMNAASALGYGANWLTGWTATHPAARGVLGLEGSETIAGIIPIGTPAEAPADRPRPDLAGIVRWWDGSTQPS